LKPRNRIVLVLAIIVFFAISCSQKKNTYVNRTFHNVTSHYNGYYWARENIKEGVDKIRRSYNEDYSKLLPLFVYGDEKQVKSNSGNFDKAIEKISRVIAYHSMLIKGKEYVKWIDENYLVLGQAHFYKKDYYAAIEVFEYIVRQYPLTPTKYQALMWLIKTYNAQNSVINTQATIDLLQNDKKFPEKFAGEFAILQAEHYIMMENYDKAIFQLTKGIGLTKKKKDKARYYFILAQLYELKGDNKKASINYANCYRLNPHYELYFNAKIKRALTTNTSALKDIKKELTKMLKDDKNIEYRDQIYFTLAEIAIKEKDTTVALKYYQASAQSSLKNVKQKGQSYLKAADIFFEQTEYRIAQAYYDSAVTFLPKEYKDYNFIVNKKNSLTGLVKNLDIIIAEDSLQRIAKMDSVKRNKLIRKIIDQLIADEKKKEEEKQNQQNNNQFNVGNNNNNNNGNNQNLGGTWYFYNPSQVSFGFSDFIKKWGPRENEDNWRRGNREVFIDPNANNGNDNPKDTGKKTTTIADNKKIEYYLKNLPLTEEQKQKSRDKIIEGYYNSGSIYKEQLKDYPKAIAQFEELNKRFPENKYLLQNYYQLYRINLVIKDNKRAEYYKNIFLTKYPDTEYAKIIKNPAYSSELMASKNEVENFYNVTYASYVAGKYVDVLQNVKRADSIYAKSELMPKFALLGAYAAGKSIGISEYESALTKIVVTYPKDPVKQKAQELLDQLKKYKSKGGDSLSTLKPDTVKPLFTYTNATEHYCMIIFPNEKNNLTNVKIKLADFNTQYFPLVNLSMPSVLLDATTNVITIRSFADGKKAMDYYSLLNSDLKVFEGIEMSKVIVVVISADNYTTFYKGKKVTEYKKFFQESYKYK
jgi:tetratricopeptide (TPR) repeat protein